MEINKKILYQAKAILEANKNRSVQKGKELEYEQKCIDAGICPVCGGILYSKYKMWVWGTSYLLRKCTVDKSHYNKKEYFDDFE